MALFRRTISKCATRNMRGNLFLDAGYFRRITRLATLLLRVLFLFCAEKDHYRERIVASGNPHVGEGQDRRYLGGGTRRESDIYKCGIGGFAPRHARRGKGDPHPRGPGPGLATAADQNQGQIQDGPRKQKEIRHLSLEG